MTAEEFGGAVHDQIRTEFQRTLKDGSGKGVVDGYRDPMSETLLCRSHLGHDIGDIYHGQSRVGWRLEEDQVCVLPK
jgi:hypothetical protein